MTEKIEPSLETKKGSTSSTTRFGFVALIGAPNAGKSTLLNAILETRLAAVSPRPQTTRTRLVGIHTHETAQIAFVDTPGVLNASGRLERAMAAHAWSEAAEADLCVVLIDVARKSTHNQAEDILTKLFEQKARVAIALNKVDLIKRSNLLDLATKFSATGPVEDVYMISALKNHGIHQMIRAVTKTLPDGPWLYSEDEISDAPMKMIATEITREKLFQRLREELPYGLTVINDEWVWRSGGIARIQQSVVLEDHRHKPMILGRGGQMIKTVRKAAQAHISEILGQPVQLFLQVRVEEGWKSDRAHFERMGLEFHGKSS